MDGLLVQVKFDEKFIHYFFEYLPRGGGETRAIVRPSLFLLFFVPAVHLSIFTFLILSSSVSLSYFILAVLMRKCSGKQSCMSSTLHIAILNGTCLFSSAKAMKNWNGSASHYRRRVDNFLLFDCLSPFFLLIKFHYTFSFFFIKFYNIMFIIIELWLGCDRPSGLFFSCPLCFFPSSLLSSYLLRLFLYLISFLVFPCASVKEKKMCTSSSISHSLTEWYLLFSLCESNE